MLSHTGDVRPDVAGIFTDLPDASTTGTAAALSLTADTRFATTPSPLKIALAVGCLMGLGAAVRPAPVGGPGAARGCGCCRAAGGAPARSTPWWRRCWACGG